MSEVDIHHNIIKFGDFLAPIDWLTATPYVVEDMRYESNLVYQCMEAHTSGVFATDAAAGKWIQANNTTKIGAGIILRSYGQCTKNVTLSDNTVSAGTAGENDSSIQGIQLATVDYSESSGKEVEFTDATFVQPAVDDSVQISIESTPSGGNNGDTSEFFPGNWVRVGKSGAEYGGFYEIESIDSSSLMTIVLKNMGKPSAASTVISTAATVDFVGSPHTGVKISKNILEDCDMLVGFSNGLNIGDNEFTGDRKGSIRFNGDSDNAVVKDNDVSHIRLDGTFRGIVKNNDMINSRATRVIDITNNTDSLGFDDDCTLVLKGNTIIDYTPSPTYSKAVRLNGSGTVDITSKGNTMQGGTSSSSIDYGSQDKTVFKSFGDDLKNGNLDGDPFSFSSAIHALETLDFDLTSVQSEELTVTVTGAADGDLTWVAPTDAVTGTGVIYTAWVSAANTVTVQASRSGTSAPNPASGNFKILVIKQ